VAFQDISKDDSPKEKIKKLEKNIHVLETILDNAYEGIVVVDKDGYIRKFNSAYEKFLGVSREEVIGKHVTDAIENTRMHEIVRSGEPEIGYIQHLKGHEIIASRIPIKDNGEIIGGVGKILFQDIEELKSLAQRLEVLENRLNYYKSEVKRLQQAKYSFDNIITHNNKMEYLKKTAEKAADGNSTVLVQGESGTGKELFAHAIHKASHRKYGAFVRVNCAAIPRQLLESELFGYEAGAFTGARKEGKPGKFELANGGTIFLDEIASMPIEMQAKLLRVIQERELERVGGTETVELDVRIIAATNKDLGEQVKTDEFREDLYYRLNVIRLQIPPLRERLDDIPLLANSILEELKEELNLDKKEFVPETINSLKDYDWPGNVRELHNFIERAVNLASGQKIYPSHLPPIISESSSKSVNSVSKLKDIVAMAEKKAIIEAIGKTKGNRTEAAELLGIHRTSLYQKIKKYGIDLEQL
jgi:PAS domain S-box-containing protein